MNKSMIVMGALTIVVFGVLIDGFVVYKLYNWFVVTQFGVKDISVMMAIGVSMTARMFVATYNPQKEKEVDWTSALSYIFIRPLVVLCIGWLVSLSI